VRGDTVSIADSIESIHYSQVVAASGLGEGEIPGLNIASLLEASTKQNLLTFESWQAVLPMTKPILPKGHSPFASKYGLHHGRDGVCTTLEMTVISVSKRVVRKRSEIIRFKVKSGQSTGSVRILAVNSGLPTGGNSYGNRVAIVPFMYVRQEVFTNQYGEIPSGLPNGLPLSIHAISNALWCEAMETM
jgi:hypothetical protein